jgi:hypothetical protein
MDELSVDSELSEAETATADEVKERINSKIKKIYGVTPEGEYFPYVRLLCVSRVREVLEKQRNPDTAEEEPYC